jgi:hypothetical protein
MGISFCEFHGLLLPGLNAELRRDCATTKIYNLKCEK